MPKNSNDVHSLSGLGKRDIFSYMNVKFLVYLVECACTIKIISGGCVLSLQQSTHREKKTEKRKEKKKEAA